MQEVDLTLPRSNQRAVRKLFDGFNGNISVNLYPVDAKNLRFNAAVTFETGDAGTPTVEFVPCSDSGKVKVFGDVDDVMKWCNGAFYEIATFSSTVVGFDDVNKPFVPPTDAVTDATRQVERYTDWKAKQDELLATAQGKVDAEIAAGWDVSQYQSLLDRHAETLRIRDAVAEISAFYDTQITFYQAVIDAAA